MQFDSIFWVAMQSSVVLGLVHGINPCGHSWLVLAPFVYGEKRGGRVASLTSAFILGTSLGCLAIGLTLGSISLAIPPSFAWYADLVTFGVLLVLGLILIVKPGLLHSHDHDHDHHHDHDHDHDDHDHHEHDGHDHGCACRTRSAARTVTFWGLFTIGFVNMVVPCPTVAIMYSYALDAGSVLKATLVFGAYALGTGIALSGVIYAIYRAAGFVRTLSQEWVEPLVMRVAGILTIGFGAYALYASM